MPRGRRNVENEPRGICVCGRPTIAIEDSGQTNRRMVCYRCRLPSIECKCVHVEKRYCERCGQEIGVQEPGDGVLFVPSLTKGHVCKG